MAEVKFTNPQTAEKYELVSPIDKRITVHKQFSGMLSAITPEVAAGLVARGSNLVKAKEGSKSNKGTPPAPASEAPAAEAGNGK